VHRFPGSMAARIQTLARIVVDDLNGDASAVWRDATDGADLVKRLAALPGFGPQKAKIFGALLGKQLGVRPRGWRQATDPFGQARSHLSVADVVDAKSLGKVREYKQQMKAAAKAGS
jgi:uncharacterized HhH-GPD family protein